MRPATVVSRHGYSMTDLLCIMCVAGIVVSVGLPLISAARKQTRADLSRARLVELSKLQLRYANDYGGTFYFPWVQQPFASGFSIHARSGGLWKLTTSGEQLGMMWYSHLQQEYGTIAEKGELTQFAPDDAMRVGQFRDAINTRPDWIEDGIWACSYQLSPTVWYKPSMYAAENSRNDHISSNLRPNRIDDVANPSSKVLLFERLGFYNAAGSPVGVSGQPRTWAHPDARVNVSLVDGSVVPIEMQAVDALATSADPWINSVFMPSGTWKLGLAQGLTDDMLPPVNPYPAGLTDFRAFFWATRNGVAGRDIDRERMGRVKPQNISPMMTVQPIQ